ncbi:MAG: hypothetical protein AB2L18_00985 [Anaerolineaceae bacterium]
MLDDKQSKWNTKLTEKRNNTESMFVPKIIDDRFTNIENVFLDNVKNGNQHTKVQQCREKKEKTSI